MSQTNEIISGVNAENLAHYEVITAGPYEYFSAMSFIVLDSAEILKGFDEVDAKKKVEVVVTIDGETKEFTLYQFKVLLGFADRFPS